jgi:hypothetical protein
MRLSLLPIGLLMGRLSSSSMGLQMMLSWWSSMRLLMLVGLSLVAWIRMLWSLMGMPLPMPEMMPLVEEGPKVMVPRAQGRLVSRKLLKMPDDLLLVLSSSAGRALLSPEM